MLYKAVKTFLGTLRSNVKTTECDRPLFGQPPVQAKITYNPDGDNKIECPHYAGAGYCGANPVLQSTCEYLHKLPKLKSLGFKE